MIKIKSKSKPYPNTKGKMKSSKRMVSAIDLFCGVGGLTHGLEKSGIDVRLGIDIDPMCQYPYDENNKAKFLLRSIEGIKDKEIRWYYPKGSIRLLAGCAPCQTFSTYNWKADSSDKRWWLLLEFSRLVKKIKPELVTMENVPRVLDQDVFNQFVSDLESLSYNVSYQIVSCADYGIPQRRNRLVLLASKLGSINLITPKEWKRKPSTVRKAIGKLKPLKAGNSDNKDPLHHSATLTEINLLRIKASRPGGTWRDWDKKLVVECHKKKTGKTYPGVYGRMVWDKPAPTITTQFFGFGNGRFGHPTQDRAISLREGAILQSFPKSYKFISPEKEIARKDLGRLIGNAVPVKLGEIIGKSILKHVESYKSKRRLLERKQS